MNGRKAKNLRRQARREWEQARPPRLSGLKRAKRLMLRTMWWVRGKRCAWRDQDFIRQIYGSRKRYEKETKKRHNRKLRGKQR